MMNPKKPYTTEYRYDHDTEMVHVIKTYLKPDTRTDAERVQDAALDSLCRDAQDNVQKGKDVK